MIVSVILERRAFVVELRWPETSVQGNLENAEWTWTAAASMLQCFDLKCLPIHMFVGTVTFRIPRYRYKPTF